MINDPHVLCPPTLKSFQVPHSDIYSLNKPWRITVLWDYSKILPSDGCSDNRKMAATILFMKF